MPENSASTISKQVGELSWGCASPSHVLPHPWYLRCGWRILLSGGNVASISKKYPCYREHAEEEKMAFLQEGQSMAKPSFTSLMDKRSTKGHVIATNIRIVRNLSLKYSLNQQNVKMKQANNQHWTKQAKPPPGPTRKDTKCHIETQKTVQTCVSESILILLNV